MSPSPSATLHILTDSVAALAALPEGAEAWCWMTDIGPGGRAALVVVPRDVDPGGAALREQVGLCIGYSRELGSVSAGIIRRMGDRHVLISQQDPEVSLRIHAALCAGPLTGALPALTVVEMRGSALVRSASGANLSAQVQQLEAGRGVFYLLFGKGMETPRLLLASDEGALKPLVVAEKARLTGKSRGVRGRFRRSKKGSVEFRASRTTENVLPSIIAWTAANQGRWSDLRSLHDARLSLVDDDGQIIARHHDEAAWKAIA
ncbi:MAG: hypothetical protein ACI8RZ_001379 [Myxococcota bacterium]|jgi:hypothetical protein